MLKLSQNALGMLIAKYRAVLKNMRLKAPALLAACCLLALAPAPAGANYIITYPGNGVLQTAPNWGGLPNSLFPGAETNPGYAGNTVIVNYTPDGGTPNPAFVFGGLSDSNNVTGNNVTIKNGKVLPPAGELYRSIVFGGYNYSYNGDATNNSVTISGGAEVYGGVIGGDGFNVTNNSVTISDNAKVTYDVIGGNGYGSAATNNSVTISGYAEVSGFVTGGNGYSSSGNAISNSVTISGNATVSRDVTGGFSYGNAISNSVTVSDNAKVSIDVYGGDGCVATNNSVTISGNATVSRDVYGGNGYGYVSAYDDYYGDANNNSVTISGGTVSGNVIGGRGYNVANNNSVTVSGGTVYGGIIGGSTGGKIPGWIGGNATYNSVTVSGDATAGEFIYGGLSFNGDATHNSVTISGSPNLTSSDLYGGDGTWGSIDSGDVFTGNTLNVYSYKGESVKSINNFQNYDFFLPASMDYTKPLLEVSKWANPAGSGDITVRGVGIEGGGTPLAVGKEVKLIAAGIIPYVGGLAKDNVQGLKGVSLLYDFKLDMGITTENTLTAKVTGVKANPQAKSLSEGRAATMGFLNQGADLAVGQGIADALNKTAQAGSEKTAFGAFSFGPARYNTGSHADVNGVSLLSGIAWKTETEKASILKGIFLEGGMGNYDTYNSFTNTASVSTYGDTSYYGLGALIRRDAASGSYIEGSLRTGRSRTALNGGDLKDYLGQTATYTSSPAYYGAHLGIGRAKTKGDKTVDYYAKYFWTHQNGDDVNIFGDTFSFAASDSHRLRGGARLTKEKPGGRIAAYAGLAYEYEFDGKAKASVHGYDIDAPGLKGGTGIVELGMSYKTHADSMNTLSLSLQGYAGKRQGLTGSVQLKRVF